MVAIRLGSSDFGDLPRKIECIKLHVTGVRKNENMYISSIMQTVFVMFYYG